MSPRQRISRSHGATPRAASIADPAGGAAPGADVLAGLPAGRESTPEQIAYLRGRRYLDALLTAGRPVLRQPHRTTLKHAVLLLPFLQSDPGSKIADALAAAFGTDRRTVQADARYAAAVVTIELNCGEQARGIVLRGGPLLDRKTAEQVSRTAPPRQRYEMWQIAQGRRAMRGPAPVFDTVDFGEIVSRLRRAEGLVRKGLRVLQAAIVAAPPNPAEGSALAHKARTIVEGALTLAAGVRSAPPAEPDEAEHHEARPSKRAARWSRAILQSPTYGHAAGRLNQAYGLIYKSSRDLPTLLELVNPTAAEKGNVESLVGRIVEDVGAILHALGDLVGT